MRIVPDNAYVQYVDCEELGKPFDAYFKEATIEITDNEWDEIFRLYYLYLESLLGHDGKLRNPQERTMYFAQYLKELIFLKQESKLTPKHP